MDCLTVTATQREPYLKTSPYKTRLEIHSGVSTMVLWDKEKMCSGGEAFTHIHTSAAHSQSCTQTQ